MDLSVTVAIIGVIVGTISLYYTRRQTLVTENQAPVTQEAQTNDPFYDRFTRAIDQLGSEKIEIRLGAISALELIANKSSDDYYQRVMEFLTAYIREK